MLTATMAVSVGGNVFCLSVVLAVLLLLVLLLHKLQQWLYDKPSLPFGIQLRHCG